MISVSEARARLLALVDPLPQEEVYLPDAAGRVLASDVTAQRDQPPFAASAMDGYAVQTAEAKPGASFTVIGKAAAGRRFDGAVGRGQAVRIFTGAPVPTGADFVVIQEDVDRSGDTITVSEDPGPSHHIRPAGGDFKAGTTLPAPRRLAPTDIALLAAMNVSRVPVTRKPRVALIATGDELVLPGETPNEDQILASNTFGLKAMLDAIGAAPHLLPVARDTMSSLRTAFDLAEGADLIITVGGASVGDHDLVADAAAIQGMDRAFYKVAMRPGKPLMAGKIGRSVMVGLPGNPVSAMVCGHIFIQPMIRRMLGLPDEVPQHKTARLQTAIGPNGPREHFMRAHLGPDGITAFERQDSSLLTVLADANILLIRPPNDPARAAGVEVTYLDL